MGVSVGDKKDDETDKFCWSKLKLPFSPYKNWMSDKTSTILFSKTIVLLDKKILEIKNRSKLERPFPWPRHYQARAE